MVSLKWCCKQKDGIKIVNPNDNLALGYIKMAEDSLGTMNREKPYNRTFAVSACYYSMYYSLYSVCAKIGVKCEIHNCTIEFMKQILNEFYSKKDLNIIKKAFDIRIIVQYYVDKIVDSNDINLIFSIAPLFVSKTKEILMKINEDKIKEIRRKIEEIIN
mgnify:CR=1 FL=1